MSSTPVTPTSSLGSPTKSGLPALKTVEVQPNMRSKPISMDASLLRIKTIEVALIPNQDTTEKDPFYEIALFLQQPQGHIAATKMKPSAIDESAGPDVRIVRRISEFATLRDKIHLCAKPLPRGDPCAFCTQLTEFLSYGSVRPAVFAHALKAPTQDASPLLTAFLRRVLEECREQTQSGRSVNCRGARHVVCLVHLFLVPTQP